MGVGKRHTRHAVKRLYRRLDVPFISLVIVLLFLDGGAIAVAGIHPDELVVGSNVAGGKGNESNAGKDGLERPRGQPLCYKQLQIRPQFTQISHTERDQIPAKSACPFGIPSKPPYWLAFIENLNTSS